MTIGEYGLDLASQLRAHYDGHRVLTGRAEQVVEALAAAGLKLAPIDCPQAEGAGEAVDEVTVRLPEPTAWVDAVDDHDEDTVIPSWDIDTLAPGRAISAWTNGIAIDGDLGEGSRVDAIEQDALRVLAAVAAHRQYAAGGER